MSTDIEAFAAHRYAFIDPRTRDGAPFPANEVSLDYADTARCGELAELARFDPYEALGGTSGNTLCVIKYDFTDEEFPWCGCQIIQRLDATDFLCRYARRVALAVAGRWSPPPSVREFLVTGDLKSALTVVNHVRIVKKKGRKASSTQMEEENSARSAARFAALGALFAYRESDELIRRNAAAVFGMAIYAADDSEWNLHGARQFNDFVFQELILDPLR